MSLLRTVPSVGGRVLLAVVALTLVIGIVVVFSGTLTRSTDMEARAEQARAERDRAQAAVEAGELELQFVRSDEFVLWQARALGMGEKGEQPFELPEDAPSPAPIVPIGPQDEGPRPMAPFDAWMELLFGA